MPTLPSLLEQLRTQGHRISRGRTYVLQYLLRCHTPLSASELHQMMIHDCISLDLATVYRELQFLTEYNLTTLVSFADGIKRYEITSQHCHRHHAICTECHSVTPVDMECTPFQSIEQSVEQQQGFHVQRHSIEFYGMCRKCM